MPHATLSKVNTIEGSWLGPGYYSKIKPVLLNAGIEAARQETLPLLNLENDTYWSSMQATNKIDIAMMDHRHWFFDDETFERYINKIASIPFRAVSLFESPYGYERPQHISITDFDDMLKKRTRIASARIRAKQKNTLILSPAICIVDHDYRERYLDYFIQSRNAFDVYQLHYYYEAKEQTVGLVTAFLNQVVTTLNKPVWVTRWNVPCCDHRIENPFALGISTFMPPSQSDAAIKLRYVFREIDALCPANSKWFFSHSEKDGYRPDKRPSDPYFAASSLIRERHKDGLWGSSDFIGLMDHRGKTKKPLLNALSSIAKEQNG